MSHWTGVLLLLPVALAPGCAPPQPPAPEGVLKIAYNVWTDPENDEYEIFVMNLDGSGKKNICNTAGVDWVYYALEDKLYFVSDRDDEHRKYHLYEMDANGGNVRMITPFRVRDSWLGSRKDGSEFVISSAKDGGPELYLIDRNGNELRRLTDDEHYDNDPFFSPDGSQIVFRSKRSETGFDELWIMNADGDGQPRQLTRFPANADMGSQYGYHAGPPFWEPNRNLISYLSKRDGDNAIFTIKPDGTDVRLLIDRPGGEGWHAWSPDGGMVAFGGTDEQGNYDIYLLHVDTGKIDRLTDSPLHEQAPVFVVDMNP